MKVQYNFDLKDGYLVAFIDIIGFSNLMRENQNIDNNSKGFTINYSVFFDNILNKYTEEYQKLKGIKFLFISDSIFISTENCNFDSLIEEIRYICEQLFSCSLSFRGGIAEGKLHFENNIWGPSVVEAVELEKTAHNPCIIIKKSTIEMYLDKVNAAYFKPVYYDPTKGCKTDYLFYDFFLSCFNMLENDTLLPSFVSQYTKTIVENYNQCIDDKHKSKWRFLANELILAIRKKHIAIDKLYFDSLRKTSEPMLKESSYYINMLKQICQEENFNG